MEQSPLIYLAPFQGVTNVVFRNVFSKHFKGVDKFYTPFFMGIQHQSRLSPRKLMEIGSSHMNGIPVVPQILSKDAGEILRFAEICRQMGFSELNWNLGCPYPQVADKKRGSGMLPYPDMIGEILDKVMPVVQISLSVKCRLGYYSADEIVKLVSIFNKCPLSELTLHARIGKQLYAGKPDLETFEKVSQLFRMPVVYNGDIFSVNDFRSVNNRFSHLHACMIGRGILTDPFLPGDIKGIIINHNRQEYINRFMDDLYFAYRQYAKDRLSILGTLKEYWSYLASSFNEPKDILRKIRKANDFDTYENAVSFIFSEFSWLGSEKERIV